jgi:hypothetical protein
MQRGGKIDPRHLRPVGLVLGPGHVDGARHDLPDAVEADPVAVGAAAAIGRHGGQDDVGFCRLQAVVVEPHGRERLRRQVGHHDVGGLHQLAHDLLAFGPHRVERHAALVAVHLQVERAFAGRRDRRLVAVLAAITLLDPDHLGAVLGHQRRTIRTRNVPAEIEHANARKNARPRL